MSLDIEVSNLGVAITAAMAGLYLLSLLLTALTSRPPAMHPEQRTTE